MVVDLTEGSRVPREADAVVNVSTEPIPLAIMVADCVPIAIRGDRGYGVVHGGWRSLAAGIIPAACRLIGARQAWIGPHIRPCHYEVGDDVSRSFAASFPDAPAMDVQMDGSSRFDLGRAATWCLGSCGVEVAHMSQRCTFCSTDLYSYRRDGRTGRQAVVMWG